MTIKTFKDDLKLKANLTFPYRILIGIIGSMSESQQEPEIYDVVSAKHCEGLGLVVTVINKYSDGIPRDDINVITYL